MNKSALTAFGGIIAALVVAGLITFAASQHSIPAFGVPLFALCAVFAFVIQWLAFIHAWAGRTEKYFDLMGSLTYISVVILALALNDSLGPRDYLIGGMIVIWAARLGSFLFARISHEGFDRRFNNMKHNFPQFLMTWTLQGLWVTFTAAAGIAAIVSTKPESLGVWALVGSLIWLGGFALEVAADEQKKAFKRDPANEDRFIDTGVWAWSRHPNYFGEIALWTGIAIIAVPQLVGWQLITLISPVFVFVLLNYISGVRMLEHRANKRWGDDPAYQDYKKKTPVLVPMPPRR